MLYFRAWKHVHSLPILPKWSSVSLPRLGPRITDHERRLIQTSMIRFSRQTNKQDGRTTPVTVTAPVLDNDRYKEASPWIDRLLPKQLMPYARLARLDRPIGTWLLYLPCSKHN